MPYRNYNQHYLSKVVLCDVSYIEFIDIINKILSLHFDINNLLYVKAIIDVPINVADQ
jgi:hypothetical protein